MTLLTSHPLHNDKLSCYAQQILQFSWAMYSFHGGHFVSNIQSWNLPFCISITCNPYKSGCLLFQEFTSCCHKFSSANEMLHHTRASGVTSVINGYLIHLPCFQTSNRTTMFWQLQAAIISQLQLICLLLMIIATIHPDHNGRGVKTFSSKLKLSGWILSSTIQMFDSQSWVILLPAHVASSLPFIHPVPQMLNQCYLNTHHQYPYAHLVIFLGNRLIRRSCYFIGLR